MMKLTDTSVTKVVDINGTNVIIKPLLPNQRRKAMLTWGTLSAIKEDASDEEIAYITISNVDRDKLAALLIPAIESIDRTDFPQKFKKCPVLDILLVMEDEDFWKLAMLIIPNKGITEEEVKNSDSSSAQDTLESPGDAGALVEKEDEPASTTPTE